MIESDFVPLLKSETGVEYSFAIDEGKMYLRAVQDVYDILENNKAMFTANNGYAPQKWMQRVSSIPHILRLKWLFEEGWDCQKIEHREMLDRKLNSSDYRHLRTAPGRI